MKHRNARRGSRHILPAIVLATIGTQASADEEQVRPLAPVVVTATRQEQSSFDLPVSIDAMDKQDIQQGQPTVNLSESLVRAPGVIVHNRQNYAQDLQISTRGFGARSTFGVRGIRLIADDIPLTMPDGQGQAATFDLAAARRVEVMRGPFSALYGNSSGGVIQVFTEDGPPEPTVTGSGWWGSYGSHKYDLKAGGDTGRINYLIDVSEFETDGYRDHSAAQRDQQNAKVRFRLDDAATLTLVVNGLHQPDTQDPLGLTRAQLTADPRQAGVNAVSYDTRKSIDNKQGGMVYERRLTADDTMRMMAYYGTRQVTQYLALPATSETSPANSGGVVDLDRHFAGGDLRLNHRTTLGGGPMDFTVGVSYDRMLELRKGYLNFTGPAANPTQTGVQGSLRRNEDNTVTSFDQYAQAQWQPGDNWRLIAGVRNTSVRFKSEDHYVVAGNGNDSGSVTYNNTSPVLGALYHVTDTFNLYANYGQGFETPTLNELAYKTVGTASGLNFGLQPDKSDNVEIGAKLLVGNATRVNIALFEIDTRNEIVPAANQSGRSTYQNASKTRRQGLELAVEHDFGSGFGGYATYSLLDAKFRDPFTSTSTVFVAGSPVTTSTNVPGGNKLAGVPRSSAYAELSWRRGMFACAVESIYSDKIYVDDANSDSASGYTIFNLRATLDQDIGRWHVQEFARVENVGDRQYVGSVIVNESNRRFFESAPGRNYMVGVRAAYRF